MRLIKQLSDDIIINIDEARDKIGTAYRLHDENPDAAAWYKKMAESHIQFNQQAHGIVAKLISDHKSSADYAARKDYYDGMLDAWNTIHTDTMEKTAEVQTMITLYK